MDESGVGIRAGSGMNLHKLAAHFAIVNGSLTNQINYLVVIYLFTIDLSAGYLPFITKCSSKILQLTKMSNSLPTNK